MKTKTTIFLITHLLFCHTLFSQIQFDKLDSDDKVISQLFDAKIIEKDSSFYWFPNTSESVQFDSDKTDTLFTKIDTIFKYGLKKIYLTKTFKFNNTCHSCQPSLGIVELQFDELNQKYNVVVCNKFVNKYGTWGESPKERYLMQISEDEYGFIIVENYLGGGIEGKSTSIYNNGKKIFSYISFLDENAFENEKLNSRYSSTIFYNKKNNSIVITKKGKSNEMNELIPINQISTFKYNDEFLIKISSKNLLKKK